MRALDTAASVEAVLDVHAISVDGTDLSIGADLDSSAAPERYRSSESRPVSVPGNVPGSTPRQVAAGPTRGRTSPAHRVRCVRMCSSSPVPAGSCAGPCGPGPGTGGRRMRPSRWLARRRMRRRTSLGGGFWCRGRCLRLLLCGTRCHKQSDQQGNKHDPFLPTLYAFRNNTRRNNSLRNNVLEDPILQNRVHGKLLASKSRLVVTSPTETFQLISNLQMLRIHTVGGATKL